jgi:hypothetical protein
MPWAAGARMRVACFFLGFFNTMIKYMDSEIGNKVEKWRQNYLHTGDIDNDSNRQEFWKNVVEAALRELRPGTKSRDVMERWLTQEPSPLTSNRKIGAYLTLILEKPITRFFRHRVTKQCLDMSKASFKGSSGRDAIVQQVVPFLFIVDEAAHLHQSNYIHSFMWVLDQPITEILSKIQVPSGGPHASSSDFFVLILGTHSEISHFAPHYIYPSERFFLGKQYIPSVFLSMDWDTGIRRSNGESKLEATSHISNLIQWGRPLWSAVYNGDHSPEDEDEEPDPALTDTNNLKRCVLFAERKLLPPNEDKEELNLSAFAILSIRLNLDLDFVYPTRASKLVASRMRWLVDVDANRKHIVTTYGSEPLLVEGAALAMNSYDLYGDKNPIGKLIEGLRDQLNQGFVDRGENGELTARILCKASIECGLIYSSLS